jgi:hypothetical protein
MGIRNIGVTTALVLAVSCAGVNAEEKKEVGSGPNPFTDCGIGAALFPNTDWAAVTSNIIWDIGITASISATASPETCSKKKVAAAVFISNTYASLVEETAAGSGQHLTTLLNILECKEQNHAAVIDTVRADVAGNVNAADYTSQSHVDRASGYYNAVTSAVAGNCTA